VLIWARGGLALRSPKPAHLGLKRWARDLFQMNGFLVLDQTLYLLEVHLNRAYPLSTMLSIGLAALFAGEQVATCFGKILVYKLN
jgi:hypothetical protein